MTEPVLTCPECGSDRVTTEHQAYQRCAEHKKELEALQSQKAVAWARPVFATEAVEPFDKGDLVDVEFYNHPERPEGEGWRPLVFADTDDARAARKQGANHD